MGSLSTSRGVSISMRLANALPSSATIQDGGVFGEYDNVLAGGINLRIFPHYDGFKSFVVLSSRPSITSFDFVLDGHGLSLSQDQEGVPGALENHGHKRSCR